MVGAKNRFAILFLAGIAAILAPAIPSVVYANHQERAAASAMESVLEKGSPREYDLPGGSYILQVSAGGLVKTGGNASDACFRCHPVGDAAFICNHECTPGSDHRLKSDGLIVILDNTDKDLCTGCH